MSTPPLPFWTTAASDAVFTEPAGIAARADRFAQAITRRNRIERWSAIAQLPVWGVMAGFFFYAGEWLVAAAMIAVAVGVVMILRNLARHAALLEPRPEEPCVMHLERQYAHQLKALRSAARWYVAPVLPGVAALFAAMIAGVAEVQGWRAALAGAAVPMGLTAGIFAAVIALNRIAARQLARDLAALASLAERG